MPRYAAFLRGVMPTNCKMAELKQSFEDAGFTDVKTILGSGNVVFTTRSPSEAAIAKKAEAAMQKRLGRSFLPFIRSIDDLQELLASDPFGAHRVPAGSKRVVTFLPAPPTKKVAFPVSLEGARIHSMKGREVFTTYVRGASSPDFMILIKKTFGDDVTTRTWETIEKVAK